MRDLDQVKARDVDGALTRAVELAEEDPLPGPEREAAVADRHEHVGAHERRADVRRGVLLALFDVLPGPVLGDDPLERGLEVARDGRVGVLVDRDARGGVRDVDEGRRRAVELAEGRLHLPRDVDELAPALGLHSQLAARRVS